MVHLSCLSSPDKTEEERRQHLAEKRVRWGPVKYELLTLGGYLLVLYICYGLLYWGFLSAALKVRGHDWWSLPNECIDISSYNNYETLLLQLYPGLIVTSDGMLEEIPQELLDIQTAILDESVTGSHMCDSQEFNSVRA
mmetsp:Transcript_2410/g.8684  ORF Transcript_2410/g.8684 Transcript_2410/m.8684 type:complete len:139 (+) Transcript_2410:146-562(+)